ncbi:MAG: Dabb family protein [Planctomycetota bacterium]
MKRHLLLIGSLVIAVSLVMNFSSKAEDASSQPDKLLRHVVMFQFNETSSPAEIQTVVDAFNGLESKIPEIHDYEYGTNNSPEKLNDGLTHCFLVTFKSEADREVYLPHPAHKAFVEVLKPHLKKVVVIDYWAQ